MISPRQARAAALPDRLAAVDAVADLEARRYVMVYPAITLAMIEEEPSEKTTPRKSEIPLNAADSDPGM
jgi:hypothetical protein